MARTARFQRVARKPGKWRRRADPKTDHILLSPILETIMTRSSTSAQLTIPAPALGEPVTAADPHPVRVQHKTVKFGDLDIFYREAGPIDAPALLLLHGFPNSSHMFRHLIVKRHFFLPFSDN